MNLPELDLTLGLPLAFETSTIFVSLLLAMLLGAACALIYRISVPGRLLSPEMQSSLVLLSMISAMVMMVIGNNVARAFSLVGALSIIRFRTRLKSPWDISFVFLALGVGIGCGVFAYKVAMMGTLMVGLAVLALFVVPLSGVKGEIHVLRCDLAAFEGTESKLGGVLDRHLIQRWLIEARSLRFGETLSYRYRVVMRDPKGIESMLREISNIEGVERVVLETDESLDNQGD